MVLVLAHGTRLTEIKKEAKSMFQVQQEQKEKRVFTKTIFIEQDVLEEMQRILDIEEGHAEEYDRDAVIKSFTTVFDTPYRKYVVGINVCNGDTPYVDPVVYKTVEENGADLWYEIFALEPSDDLEGSYTFEIEEKGVTVILNVMVASLDSIDDDNLVCPNCGNDHFFTTQNVREEVVVDGEGNQIDVVRTLSHLRTSSRRCTYCLHTYDSVDELVTAYEFKKLSRKSQ